MYEKLKNGYIAEEKFIYECLSRNIPISRPVYNIEPYDFVVEVNGKFLSVQVKKSWVDKKGRNVVCVKSSYPRSTKSKVIGKQTNVDYLAVLVGYWEGIPVCRIECIPCEMVKECPLEKKVDMSMLSVEADNGDETRRPEWVNT